MKKVLAIIVALAVFLIFLIAVIIPQQEGLISSTSQQGAGLAQADYNESLPIQLVGMGGSGRSIVIAVVMLSHILFANLQLGGAWVAAGTETAFLQSRKQRYSRLARSITLFNVILFSAGSTFAIAGVLLFISLYPTFTQEAFHIFWWPLLAETFLFAIEIFFLYTYWFSWNRFKNGWHQFLGYGYAISVFLQTLMINTLASGMLTPGSDRITWESTGLLTMSFASLSAWWFNATTWILQFHRLAAAISFIGFLLAMLGMFHYLDRQDMASKTYWDLVGSYGLSWGLIGLVFQPLIGIIFMFTIFKNQPSAFASIMLGSRAWEMVLMVGLLSILFITILVYLYDRKEKILKNPGNEKLHQAFRIFIIIAAISGFILVQPYTLASGINPLGLMSYKLIALFVLIVIGAFTFGIDLIMLREPGIVEWGALSNTSRYAAILAGMLGIFIVVVMGYVRESARSPWIMYNIIPVPGGQTYPTPIPAYQMFVVWAIIIALVMAIFWYTSRVTAEHPEEAEEV